MKADSINFRSISANAWGNMTSDLRYEDLVLDASLLFGSRGKEAIKFTRNERALLAAFTRNGNRLLSRSQLLDAVSADDFEASERNIDFLITRLRAKLGDPARAPRFIATQYGEGYVWIARPLSMKPLEAFIVIGPVSGLAGEAVEAQGQALVNLLRRRLAERTGKEGAVAVAEDFRLQSGIPHKVRFALQVSFLNEGGRLHCGAVLRNALDGRILHASRLELDPADPATFDREATALADTTKAAIWQNLTSPAANIELPLEVMVFNASRLLSEPDQSWLASGEILAKEHRDHPQDPRVAVMWAAHLYAQLVMSGVYSPLTDDDRAAMETEIERTVLTHLPAIQDDPSLSMAAAKLLHYIARGHDDLVDHLLERAFDRCTAFAASFGIIGQVRATRGLFDEAIRSYDHGIAICEPASEFHLYLLFLKAAALLASNRREELPGVIRSLQIIKPESIRSLAPFILPPDKPLDEMQERFLDGAGPEGCRKFVDYLYKTSARQFRSPRHQANVMRGIATHAMRKFGPEVAPEVVRALLARYPA